MSECFLECQELTRVGGPRQKFKDDTQERKTTTWLGFLFVCLGLLVGWFGSFLKVVNWPSKRRLLVAVLSLLASKNILDFSSKLVQMRQLSFKKTLTMCGFLAQSIALCSLDHAVGVRTL